jgi:hypothetical protein
MPISKVKLRVPQVKHKDLSADGVLGYALQEDFEIEIDPNQPSREYLDTLIHEMLHCFFARPDGKANHSYGKHHGRRNLETTLS